MKIIFVYNANSGVMNSILDMGHKLLQPETYSCNLCNITFGIISENKEWKEYRRNSNEQLEFLHKDEFEKMYGEVYSYPVVLTEKESGELKELISHNRLNSISDVKELIDLIEY